MASRFWVGGTSTWDATVGTKWALISGGAGGQPVPTAADDVFFDAASGTVTVTNAVVQVAKSINCTGFTGTLAGAGGLTVSGDFTLAAGMTYSKTGLLTINATSNITTAGKFPGHNIVLNGVGATFTLLDNLTTGSVNSLTLTAGSFNANNFAVTVGSFNSSNSNVRTITMGSGLWTFTVASNATLWNTGTTTNLTFNKDTANIVVSGTGAGTKTFLCGGLTFNDLTIPSSPNNSVISFGDTATFANLLVSGATGGIIISVATVVLTLQNAPTWNGSSGNYVQISGTTAGSASVLSVATGTVSINYGAIRGMSFSGGATFVATNSYDLTGNSGITITAPLVRQPTYAVGI